MASALLHLGLPLRFVRTSLFTNLSGALCRALFCRPFSAFIYGSQKSFELWSSRLSKRFVLMAIGADILPV